MLLNRTFFYKAQRSDKGENIKQAVHHNFDEIIKK